MAAFDRFNRIASVVLMVLGGIAVLAMMLHVVVDILSKSLFRYPIPGTLEVVANYYMVAVAFLPVAYVQLRREHLVVEVFTMGLSPRGIAFVDGIVGILGTMYLGLLTYLVFGNAVDATRIRSYVDITLFDLSTWPARWILPASFLAMAAVLISQLIADFRFAFTGKGREPETPDAGELPASGAS